MAICYLNGREYNISKKIILDYINSYGTKFTKAEKDKIANEVMFRMESLEVNGMDCQEYNFIEERYTEACMCYIFDHDDRVEALLNEKDDCNIWDYLDLDEEDEEDEEDDMEEFVEYARIYIHDVDDDLNELENHLSMNGYDFGIDVKRRMLFVCIDELSYVETILTDRNIDYRVRVY